MGAYIKMAIFSSTMGVLRYIWALEQQLREVLLLSVLQSFFSVSLYMFYWSQCFMVLINSSVS